MAIEVIPTGSSAVVTNDSAEHCDIIAAVKDAEANLQNGAGTRYGNLAAFIKDADARGVETTKDAECNIRHDVKDAEGNIRRDVKDSEAQLERGGAARLIHLVQDIKDAESRILKDAGDKFIEVVQDVKDHESRAAKDRGDKFLETLKAVNESEQTTDRAKAKLLETVWQTTYAAERSQSDTREKMAAGFKEALFENCKSFDEVKSEVKDGFCHLSEKMAYGFKDVAETALRNHYENLLQFKEVEIRQEKIAANASRELMECCCEMKALVRDENGTTRALINQQEVDRLRERANKAEGQLTLLELLKAKI